jgi:hypothetical protein
MRRATRHAERTAVAGALLVALLAGGVGCLRIESSLLVEPDGSGRWRLVYAMRNAVASDLTMARELAGRLMEAAGEAETNRPAAADAEIPWLFDAAAIRERFDTLGGDDIALQSLKIESRSDWRHVEMVVRFRRLDRLLSLPVFAPCAVFLRRAEDGRYTLTMRAPDLGGGQVMPKLSDREVADSLMPVLNGLRIVNRVDVPGEVRQSNATRSDTRGATWEFDFERDAQALERLDGASMEVVFDGSECALRAFEKPAASR